MKKLMRLAALSLALALLPCAAQAEYWPPSHAIRCRENRPGCLLLQVAMTGSFDGCDPGDAVGGRVLSAAYPSLCAVTDGDIDHFIAEFDEPEPTVRRAWYVALANALWADILTQTATEGSAKAARRVLLLFLDPDGEADSQAQIAQIRAELTEAALQRLADAVGAPTAFVRWLIETDDWRSPSIPV